MLSQRWKSGKMRTDIDFQRVVSIIRGVSDIEILPRFRNLSGGDISEKGPGDFVTVADLSSERALTDELGVLLPGSMVVGEEAVSKDASVLDALKGDAPVWIIDPIDGTFNFKEGRARFGVLVGLTHRGQTLAGWSFDVVNDRMAMAVQGAGAFIDQGRNSEPHPLKRHQAAAMEFKDMEGYCGGPQTTQFNAVVPSFKRLVNERSSLHDFVDFATGKVDFVLHRKTTPWDHSAGVLLAEEAGGYVGIDKNNRFRADRCGPCLLIAAPSADIHSRLFNFISREIPALA